MLSSDLQKLSVTGRVTLYELDATKLGAGVFRWHGHVSHEDWRLIFSYLDKTKYLDKTDTLNATDKQHDLVRRDIIWQGNTYSPMPIKSDGLEMRGDGKASTPSLALANNIDGLQGAVSALCLQYDDFAGARLTVINTLAKYLDAANFTDGNPSSDPNEYRKQMWFVEAKTSENRSAVVFELSNPVDFEGAKILVVTLPAFAIGVCMAAIVALNVLIVAQLGLMLKAIQLTMQQRTFVAAGCLIAVLEIMSRISGAFQARH